MTAIVGSKNEEQVTEDNALICGMEVVSECFHHLIQELGRTGCCQALIITREDLLLFGPSQCPVHVQHVVTE